MEYLISLILLMSVVLCDKVRYYIKMSMFLVVITVTSALLSPFMLLRMGDWRNLTLVLRSSQIFARVLGMSFYYRGEENIIKDTGSIVLMNHQNTLDMVVIGDLWTSLQRCTVIVKKALRYYGPFGLSLWLSGLIFIDRHNISQSQEQMKAAARRAKELNANIIIFPEGRRHSHSSLLPFKKGAFHLAIDTQLPILPVIVSKYYFLSSKRKIFNSGVSYVTILPPIPTKGLTNEDIPRLVEDTYRIMNKTFQESTQEAINEHINSFEDGK